MRHLRQINPHEISKRIRGATFEESPTAGRLEFGNFAPPWKAPDPGPDSRSGYEKLFARYEFSFHSGRGLWDFESDPNDRQRRPPRGWVTWVSESPAPMILSESDRQLLASYTEACSPPPRQMEAYLRVAVQGQSVRRAAEEMKLGANGRKDVRDYMRALLRNAQRWLDRQAGCLSR